MAQELGFGMRQLWRYRNRVVEHKDSSGHRYTSVAEDFPRVSVEEALFRAGVQIWEVYPDLEDDVPMFERRWCETCREETFVDEDDECLWCLGAREFAERKGKAA